MPEADFEVQTRDGRGDLQYFGTLKEAMDYANGGHNVWKVSFPLPTGERVRLVAWPVDETMKWVYEPIELDSILADASV